MLALSVGFSLGKYKHSISDVLEKLDNIEPMIEENSRRIDELGCNELVSAYGESLKRCSNRLNRAIEGI